MLAFFSPTSLLHSVWYIGEFCLAWGVICWLGTAYLHGAALINPSLNISNITFSNIKQMGMLWLGQSVFFLISIIFFYFLERQTQINPRLYAVESGYVVEVLQHYSFSLGLLPWLTYGILGVGLAYFSICLERQPLLSRATLLEQKETQKGKMAFFLQNLLSIITDVVTICPYVFIVSFALIWLCEIINVLFGWDPLFLTPFRTTFIYSLILLIFQKSNRQLIEWMKQQQSSVGLVLMIYIFVFAFLMSWLQGFSDWFTLGQEVTTRGKVAKSVLAGVYLENSLETRLSFFIWGWWSIWTPWMVSLVARSAIGFTLIRALLHAVLLPLLLFQWILPYFIIENSKSIERLFEIPSVQIVGLAGLLLCIWVVWGNQRTMGEVAKGVMLSIGKLSKRPLNRWMMIVTLWLACYIPGWFLLGWLPLQVIVTLGGLFMLVVIITFIGRWGASIFHLLALKKYKDLGSPSCDEKA